jgi:hypothetical protein
MTDGGFSGGNLERPALQQLIADIRAGRIDIAVVYKVDRLTRSLADFARLVELFDAGESGKNINADIASLVEKGLSSIVQKSLDVVRVVGNEAVHPGILDLRDDRDTASKLFRLINLIAERMISHPKHVDTMYEELPDSKRAEIEKRDGPR